jgi:hypothetical protein
MRALIACVNSASSRSYLNSVTYTCYLNTVLSAIAVYIVEASAVSSQAGVGRLVCVAGALWCRCVATPLHVYPPLSRQL